MTSNDRLSSSSPVSSRVCRLCLASKGQLYRIFGGGIADLPEKIYDITAIEIDDINGIPSLICELCRSQILMCHQFVLQCRVSDWKYKKQLGASPVPQNGNGLRLSSGSTSSGIEDLTVDSGRNSETPARTAEKNPVKYDALRRLKNDDHQQRRDSIDQTPKIYAKKRPQPLLDTSQIKIEPDLEGMDNRKQQCPHCGLLVIRLERHISYMHSETPKHVCRICGKVFKVRKYLECHLNHHNGIKPYKCNLCDKSYSYQNSLYDHLKTHRNRFFCSVCDAGFTHVNIMKKHMLTHRAKK